ncbi:hypothetical protein JX266_011241 [Neoarthrinium moseri]|nr:hypothetical protein JX266_011241 [Neoarthrinium moseri]
MEEGNSITRTKPRPRGRPPRALNRQDAAAVHSLRTKMQKLEDKVHTVNQMIQEELQAKRSIKQSPGSLEETPSMGVASKYLAMAEQYSEDGNDNIDPPDGRPLVTVDLSLQETTVSIHDALIGRFVDSYGSPGTTTSQPKYWIHDGRPWCLWRSGAEICAFSPLLHTAYLTIATAYSGLSLNDNRLTQAGARSYPVVLRQLQKALDDPERSKSDAVLITIGLCMTYETWGAIVSRKPSFLATPEWKTVPWSCGTTDKDLAQCLYDKMLEIPRLIWLFDQVTACCNLQEKGKLRKETSALAKDIALSLHQWKADWLDCVPQRRPYEKPLIHEDPTIPIFRYQDSSNTDTLIEPQALYYPNCAIFAAVCNYYAAILVVLDTVRLLNGQVRNQTQMTVAYEICRSMNYFLTQLPPSMLGRVAIPISAAYDTLPPGGVERKYLEDVYRSCVGGTWRSFKDFVQEFSVLEAS